MTNMETNLDELAARRLCASCVGEDYLRAEIESSGSESECYYCGKFGRSFSIAEMANVVEGAFERHYDLTPTDPSPLEYALHKEGYDWDRHGDPSREAIGAAALIDEPAAEDVRKVLADRHFDLELAQMGEECPFDKYAHYAEKDPDDILLREGWRFFENSLKTETRLFNAAARSTLDEIFEDLHEHRTNDGASVITEAGPGTDLTGIYRARVFQSFDDLRAALAKPEEALGPPPPTYALAGRMNARGIAVFYGATSEDVAVGEVRPPVGSLTCSPEESAI